MNKSFKLPNNSSSQQLPDLHIVLKPIILGFSPELNSFSEKINNMTITTQNIGDK